MIVERHRGTLHLVDEGSSSCAYSDHSGYSIRFVQGVLPENPLSRVSTEISSDPKEGFSNAMTIVV